MALLTKRWLKGNLLRLREHEPVDVTLSPEWAEERWLRDNRVKFGIRLEREDGFYHALFLSEKDTASFLQRVIAESDAKTKAAIALASLRSLDTKAVFSVLST